MTFPRVEDNERSTGVDKLMKYWVGKNGDSKPAVIKKTKKPIKLTGAYYQPDFNQYVQNNAPGGGHDIGATRTSS